MSDGMLALVGALLVPAAGAMAFIAYHHTENYYKVAGVVNGLIVVGISLLAMHDLGAQRMYGEVINTYIASGDVEAVREAGTSIIIVNYPLAFLAAGAFVYNILIQVLVEMIKDK